MQYPIQNLGLTAQGQAKATGMLTSVGTSMGFGERCDLKVPQTRIPQHRPDYEILDRPERPQVRVRELIPHEEYPGPGSHDQTSSIRLQ